MNSFHRSASQRPSQILRTTAMAAGLAFACSAPAFAQCPGWSTDFGPPPTGDGMNARVYDLTVFNDQIGSGDLLIAGGDFTQCGTATAGRVAMWNGSSWAKLGSSTGANSSVFALTAHNTASAGISTPGAEVYAGGQFTSMDGAGAQHVAVWDQTFLSWEPLVDTGTNVDGVNGNVYALVVHDTPAGKRLVVGGQFTQAGGKSANNVAMWDGSTWTALGTGTAGGSQGRVDALCSYNGVLYAGGWFTSADSSPANLVAKWNGSAWSPIGAGLSGSNVYDLVIYDDDSFGYHSPALYAGGSFAGGNVAKWTGQAWVPVGGGLNNAVRDLLPCYGPCGANLIASGHFTSVGPAGGNRIARFDGAGWVPIGNGLSGGGSAGPIALCAAEYGDPSELDDLVVGGIFTAANAQPSSFIAAACPCAPPLSMDQGKTVVTSDGVGSTPFVVTLLETRGPRATTDTNWDAPKFHNEFAPSSLSQVWNLDNLGQVFGVCMDDATPPNIYVAASSSYDVDLFGPSGPGAVYKIDGSTGDISEFAATWPNATLDCIQMGQVTLCPSSNMLPNTGPGLGDICFDVSRHVFYVSNFEDGKIYVLDMSGNVLQAWDPFAPDDGTAGFAPLGERVWALQKVGVRALFFSMWLRDAGDTSTPYPAAWPTNLGTTSPNNALFVVTTGVSGTIAGAPLLRKLMSYLPGSTYSNPVSDIAVSPDMTWPTGAGTTFLLLAERPMLSETDPGAHDARVLELGLKSASEREWFTGEYDQHRNTTGGADFDCDWEVLVTGDYLKTVDGGEVYGVQINPRSGNAQFPSSTINSYLIDLNGILGTQDKTRTGDLEVVRHCWGTQFPHGGF